MEDTVGVDAVREIVTKAGYPLSRSQLKRLRLNGLLRTPEQKHAVGVAGSSSEYTEADIQQLLAVLSLRHDMGFETFSELRVAAWLRGLDVDFQQLRPDVVEVLRAELEDHQNLRAGEEDDHIAERLHKGLADTSRADLAEADKLVSDAGGENEVSFEDVILPMLQLVIRTPDKDLGSDLLDQQLRVDNPDKKGVSDLYSEWNLPPTSQWPRVVSRSGKSAFAFGQQWLVIVRNLLKTDLFQALAASPLATEAINRITEGLEDESPANLQRRTFFACQGIVIYRSSPAKLEALPTDN